jgi:hypothetical protein
VIGCETEGEGEGEGGSQTLPKVRNVDWKKLMEVPPC